MFPVRKKKKANNPHPPIETQREQFREVVETMPESVFEEIVEEAGILKKKTAKEI